MKGKFGNARDYCQSFAAKSERGNIHQVFGTYNFACRVFLHGKQGVFGSHANAVVRYANQRFSAVNGFNFNSRCAGVDRIFNEFFDAERQAVKMCPSLNLCHGVAVKHIDFAQ